MPLTEPLNALDMIQLWAARVTRPDPTHTHSLSHAGRQAGSAVHSVTDCTSEAAKKNALIYATDTPISFFSAALRIISSHPLLHLASPLRFLFRNKVNPILGCR